MYKLTPVLLMLCYLTHARTHTHTHGHTHTHTHTHTHIYIVHEVECSLIYWFACVSSFVACILYRWKRCKGYGFKLLLSPYICGTNIPYLSIIPNYNTTTVLLFVHHALSNKWHCSVPPDSIWWVYSLNWIGQFNSHMWRTSYLNITASNHLQMFQHTHVNGKVWNANRHYLDTLRLHWFNNLSNTKSGLDQKRPRFKYTVIQYSALFSTYFTFKRSHWPNFTVYNICLRYIFAV